MRRFAARVALLGAAVLVGLVLAPTGLLGGFTDAGPGGFHTTADAADAPAASGDGSDATELTTYGCQETFATTEVPASWARPKVPPNFDVASSPFLPGGDARPTAWFVLVSSHCDTIVYDGPDAERTEVTDGERFWYAIAVDPPAAYENDDAVVHFYPLRFVVSHDEAASVLSSWDLPAETGSITLDRRVDEEQARSWTMTADKGNVSYRLDAETGSWFPFGTPLVRIFGEAQGGSVDHAVDVQPQGNTMWSWPNTLAFDLDDPDGPAPAPHTVGTSVNGNLKMTPSGQVALEGSLVSLPDAGS